MRTIKFRGKRIDNGKWVYGFYSNLFDELINKEESVISFQHIEGADMSYPYPTVNTIHALVDEKTIGQFSGITDKKGTEIYEGDLFKLGAEKQIFEVRFEHGCFMAFLNGKQYGLIGELMTCFIEVIGNIHDNPELFINGPENG